MGAPQTQQRRSQRQQQQSKEQAAVDTSPDSQPLADQEQPPSKRARKQQTSSTPPLSEIEAERLARIAANQARLAALELPQLAADLAASTAAAKKKPAAAPTQRGVSSRRSREQQEPQPRRQSARARGQAPDPTTAGGIDYEAAGGQVVLAAFVPERYGGSGGSGDSTAAAAAAVSRPPPGPLPFGSSNGDADTDAAFLQQLQQASAAAAAAAAVDEQDVGNERDASSSNNNSIDRLAQLQLQGVDVAKLTTQGVSCLAFHPSSSKPIIAAADKSGKVGLWDIDYKAAAGADGDDGSSGGYDGVLMFAPHSDYVSSLKWLGPTGAGLLTGSYDGLVRRLDVETGVWDLVGGVPAAADDDNNNWSAGDATPDGSTVYLATSSGQFTRIDTRCSNTSTPQQLLIANRKVNTLHLHSDALHLLSSASDGAVAVWDVRQLASTSSSKPKMCKPVTAAGHSKSSQGAYWEPNSGRRVLSVSFDDTLKIWQFAAGGLTQHVSIKHNNNTGRWVMPFRPAWSLADGDGVLVGDLKRGVALFRDSGAAVGVLSAEPLTAIPSRIALHRDGLLAAATSSGRVHIWR